jgi:hypothetical protein
LATTPYGAHYVHLCCFAALVWVGIINIDSN